MRILQTLPLLWAMTLWAAEPDVVFKNPTAGFEITKSAGWKFVTAEQNAKNLQATELNDEEFQAAMLKYATTPMVVMTKFAEPYDDLNPSVKVNVRPLGALKGRPATEIIGLFLPQAFAGRRFRRHRSCGLCQRAISSS